MSAEVRRAIDAAEVGQALELRRRVFCEEQGVPLAEELDGRDGEAVHLVAVEGGEVVGTCRLLSDGDDLRLGRMAVDSGRRRRGIGAALLRAADDEARAAGAVRIRLHAQIHAASLYEANGYARTGGSFLEAGIEHVTMEKGVV